MRLPLNTASRRATVGTAMLVHGRRGYEIEFMTLDRETVAVTSLQAAQVRPIGSREVAHVRGI